MNKAFINITLSFSLFGCVYYPNLDYIRYEGVDYGYAHGSEQKIYYRDYGRVTQPTDKIIAFSIGTKTLSEYNNDRAWAASLITDEVVEKEGFCPLGYTLDYHPTIKTGDHGFAWKVFCK